MTLLWSKNSKIGSHLIRLGTEGDCSHFAVCFDDVVVLQSNMHQGVNLTSLNEFKKHNTIVHEIRLNLPLELEEAIWKPLVRRLAGNYSYDFKAVIYWTYEIIKRRLLGTTLPTSNRWSESNKYLCVEIASELPGFLFGNEKIEGLDIISPEALFRIIDLKTNSSPYRVKDVQ